MSTVKLVEFAAGNFILANIAKFPFYIFGRTIAAIGADYCCKVLRQARNCLRAMQQSFRGGHLQVFVTTPEGN
jgi:hypothetical protein